MCIRDRHEPCPSWHARITQVGPLLRKSPEAGWQPGFYFVYEGNFACCHVIQDVDGSAVLDERSLDEAFCAQDGDDAPVPIPLKGAQIFAADGNPTFSVLIPKDGRVRRDYNFDFQAETVGQRDEWIKALYDAGLDKHAGTRRPYAPQGADQDRACGDDCCIC
eukprot:TRINITY_DN27285_c0_g1_i2.p1 TRINITY_DN27285_c0_g1~~TRINITY_DN27285_c0_g1_i2.p1  ORF type:complete len:163 (+),score=27.58 TRINITY_DN27285_c0_g1_i2:116-604(+)